MIFKYSTIAAEEKRDMFFREKAEKAYKIVRKFLKEISESGRKPGYLLPVDTRKGWAVEARFLGENIEEKYSLILIFAHSSGQIGDTRVTGGFGWTPNKKYAVIILNILKAPYDFTYADTRLNKDIFIHEYIHYLDAGRRKDLLQNSELKKQKNIPNLGLSEETYKYFNDPAERNAYYQESAVSFAHILEQVKEYSFEEYQEAMSQFNSFKELMIPFFREDYIQNLSPKNIKKLNKRLYNLFTHLKEQMQK